MKQEEIDLMEKAGTGIKRIRDICKDNNNPIDIRFDEHNFFVEISSNNIGREKVGEILTKNQELILDSINKNRYISIKELAKRVDIAEKNIEVNIAKLKQKGLLRRVGPDKGGYWEITQ